MQFMTEVRRPPARLLATSCNPSRLLAVHQEAADSAFIRLQVHRLSEKLLQCFSEALGLGGTLVQEHDVARDGVLAALRLLHYPDVARQEFPASYWRAGAARLWGACMVVQPCILLAGRLDWHRHRQACTTPPTTLALPAGAHTDFDTLTLLFQRVGQGGLEVCPGREVSTEFAAGAEGLQPGLGGSCSRQRVAQACT
jgi:isopenicillin N synthase-like dioxygenase